MNAQRLFFAFLAVFALILLFFGIGALLLQEGRMEDVIAACDSEDLTAYTKPIYINGERIESSSSVVTYGGKIYFSVSMLQNQISSSFILHENGSVMIRRNRIMASALLESSQDTYIDFDTLTVYAHINSDVFKVSGEMYIDSMLPQGISINGISYTMLSEPLRNDGLVSGAPDAILSDGRGVWYGTDRIYVEDDWGRIFEYKKGSDSIC